MNKPRWGCCPFFKWCPCKTATCRALLPDRTCYLYRYFKELILEDLDNGEIKTDS